MRIDCTRPHILTWAGEESLKGIISSLLRGEGFKELNASDQREMFRFLEEYQPPVVILDANLSKIMGYEVYELIKRIDRFKDVKVIVVSSTSHPGLNDTGQVEYVERGQVQDLLLTKIRTLIPGESNEDEACCQKTEESVPSAYKDAGDMADTALSASQWGMHEEARRFARIIVSDIVLYNKDKAERGASEGTFRELLKKEIEEGRRFYSNRIPEEILTTTNYYDEAIEEHIQKILVK